MTAFKEYQRRRFVRLMRETSDEMTPWELALQMVDAIPPHLFNTQALVPGSGMGTFALALVYRGWSPDKIVCIEIDEGFAIITQKHSPNITTIHADYLTWEPNMQFDVVITNVPFQAPTPEGEERNIGRQLWPLFIEKSLQLVKPGGYVSLITPATWLNRRPRSTAWNLVKDHDLVSCIPDVKWAFPKVGGNGGTFSVINLINRPYQGTTLLPDGGTCDIVNDAIPTNNALFTSENLQFLKDNLPKVLDLGATDGEAKLSINGPHWSKEHSLSHPYETYYSGRSDRRQMWCDKKVGDYGKLKLVLPNSGTFPYNNREITTKGVGRQAQYVIGTQEELQQIEALMLTKKSNKMCQLMAQGNYTSPLKWIINE